MRQNPQRCTTLQSITRKGPQAARAISSHGNAKTALVHSAHADDWPESRSRASKCLCYNGGPQSSQVEMCTLLLEAAADADSKDAYGPALSYMKAVGSSDGAVVNEAEVCGTLSTLAIV